MSGLGNKLAGLHLLEDSTVTPDAITYPETGTDRVESVRYDEKAQRIFINDRQYFGNVAPEVWDYMIGGYQVAEKWLKDRQARRINRALTPEEKKCYRKILVAIQRSITLVPQLDLVYRSIVSEKLIEPDLRSKGSK